MTDEKRYCGKKCAKNRRLIGHKNGNLGEETVKRMKCTRSVFTVAARKHDLSQDYRLFLSSVSILVAYHPLFDFSPLGTFNWHGY